MASGAGVAVFIPATSVSTVACTGLIQAGSVVQVLNLSTGMDETIAFDPYIPAADTIVQISTTPQQTSPYIVLFQVPGQPALTCKLALIQSAGETVGVPGPVVAANVVPGDIVIAAIYPLTNPAVSTPIDYTLSFAPTVTTAGTITQIAGVAQDDLVLLLLQSAGLAPPGLGLGVSCGEGPGLVNVAGCRSGDHVLYALNLSAGRAVTANYQPVSPADGVITQLPGTPQDGAIVLFLFQRAAAT